MLPLTKETPLKPKAKKYGVSRMQVNTLCNTVGLAVFMTLIGYFAFMRTLGLHEIISLRTLNAVILGAGIFYALHTLSEKEADKKIDYFEGIKAGLHVTFAAVIPFVILICLYLANDEMFMAIVRERTGMGHFLNPFIIAGGLFIEGISSGLILTFIAMQYFKKIGIG